MSWLDRAVSLALPLVPKPFVRFFSRPYIAGSSMEDAFRTVRELAGQGAMSTLDILGEFVTRREEAERSGVDYEALLRRVDEERLRETHVSVKLSALGLLVDRDLCLEQMRRLLHLATTTGNFVRIDMEDSTCTTETLRIYETLREQYPGRVGVVLQARLRRTLADIERLTARASNVRLCKGIYLEPRAIAHTDAEIIRCNFVAALERLIERGAYVAIATHDERLVWEALRLVERHALGREQYEFQMLLGVEAELRSILLREGHRLRVYVPYGDRWYQYSVRRLRENPQIAGHAFRALFRRSAQGPPGPITPTPRP
jgi:proline dehydrogenase